jgi:hypothetical protein
VKVIGAGFGRTGTMSLKAALETLGFGPCYHMVEVFEHPEHAPLWEAAWRGEPVDWDDLLGGYEAAVDWPACTFYETLMDKDPEAKVILTVRDPRRWYESVRNTIFALSMTVSGSRLLRLVFGLRSLLRYGTFARSDMAKTIIWDGTFDGRFEDEAYAIEVFERHNEEVRRRVPQERLLTYEVSEGWGPLCEFLGVDEPEEPFPRLNDTAEMRRRLRTVRAISVAASVVLGVLAVLALVLLARRVGS